jgi:hypothetical protein
MSIESVETRFAARARKSSAVKLGNSRPNLVPGIDPVTPNWSIGPYRFPTQAQVPYLNAATFAYPATFTSCTMGRNVVEAPGLT